MLRQLTTVLTSPLEQNPWHSFVPICVTVSLAQNIEFYHGHERAEFRELPEVRNFGQV